MNETKPNYRVVIAGGRDFSDYELLKEKCDDSLKDKFLTHQVIVVSGMARGADALGLSQKGRLKSSFLPAGDIDAFRCRLANDGASEEVIPFLWCGILRGSGTDIIAIVAS